MKRDKFGKPFEVILWSLLETEEQQKGMLKETMQIMLCAATGKTPEEFDRLQKKMKEADRLNDLKNGKIDP